MSHGSHGVPIDKDPRFAELEQALTAALGPFEIEVVDADQNGETFATIEEAIRYLEEQMTECGYDAATQAIRALPCETEVVEPIELTFDWHVANLRCEE